jgi:uncharacterized protein with PIN domain
MAPTQIARPRQGVHRCPKCRSHEIKRASRKNVAERVLLLLTRRRPYRCVRCRHRFYDRHA